MQLFLHQALWRCRLMFCKAASCAINATTSCKAIPSRGAPVWYESILQSRMCYSATVQLSRLQLKNNMTPLKFCGPSMARGWGELTQRADPSNTTRGELTQIVDPSRDFAMKPHTSGRGGAGGESSQLALFLGPLAGLTHRLGVGAEVSQPHWLFFSGPLRG